MAVQSMVGGGVDTGIQAKFVQVSKDLRKHLIERDEEIEVALTALVAREHCLFVGIPGTAKTLLAESLAAWMSGSKFVVLLTKYTAPEELFGPFSLQKLKQDIYERVTAGYLPEASCVVVDEIWKASSAIINTLLRVLNERKFRNGVNEIDCPLQIAIACSNEFPNEDNGGRELSAAFDRFLFRKVVNPIKGAVGLDRLLWNGSHQPQLTTSISAAEIDRAASDALGLPVSDEAKEAYRAIVAESRKEGIHVGDRRLKMGVKAARASAYVSGSAKVLPDHLGVLAHVLWDDPAEQPRKVGEIVGKIANPAGMAINSLLLEAEEVLGNTNASDLAQAAVASNKLKDINKRLKAIADGGSLKASDAVNYVEGEMLRIRKEAVGKFS